MSQGIFETLLAEQKQTNVLLEGILRALGKTPTVTLESTVDAATAQAGSTATQSLAGVSAQETATDTTNALAAAQTQAPAPAVDAKLDKDGCPWDARINTANKGVTAKNVFKRKPGITDEEYKSVRESLKAGVALATSQNAAIDAGTEIPKPDKAAALPLPPAPGTAPAPAPAPGTAPAPATDDRKLAITAVDALCTPYDISSTSTLQAGASIETFNLYCTEYFGVPTFAEVPPAFYPQIVSDLGQWAAELKLLNKQVKALLDAYSADVSMIHGHIVQVLGSDNTGIVNYSSLIDTKKRMEQYVITCLQPRG